MAARTWVHRADEREVGGKGDAAVRACYHHASVLHGLTQRLERVAREFEQFVEKQDAVVRQTDLAGSWRAAATDQPGRGHGMMRRAKWPAERDDPVEHAGDRM